MKTYNIHNGQGAFLCEVKANTERGAIRVAKKEWSGDDLKASLVPDYKSMASALGKLGGSQKSEKKKASSAENGKKGGRPKKGVS
jgi:hypothetical protein